MESPKGIAKFRANFEMKISSLALNLWPDMRLSFSLFLFLFFSSLQIALSILQAAHELFHHSTGREDTFKFAKSSFAEVLEKKFRT